jgi:hypothetical protein
MAPSLHAEVEVQSVESAASALPCANVTVSSLDGDHGLSNNRLADAIPPSRLIVPRRVV